MLTDKRLADPSDIEDSDDPRCAVGVQAQQPVPGTEYRHAEGRIIAGRHHRRATGLVHQTDVHGSLQAGDIARAALSEQVSAIAAASLPGNTRLSAMPHA